MSKLNSKKKSPFIEHLKNICLALYSSGDRIEDAFWEKKILQLIQIHFSEKKQKILDQTIDLLQKENSNACAGLIELIETSTQTLQIESIDNDSQNFEALLLAAPILAWTNYKIPSGKINLALAKRFHDAFTRHIASPESKVIFYRHLFVNEELPENHLGILKLTKKLSSGLAKNQFLTIRKETTIDCSNVFTDIRYLIGLIATPAGLPLFRWQTIGPDGNYFTKTQCLEAWQQDLSEIFREYFLGCEFKASLPNAFYSACREANEEIRAHAILHAANYLANTLKVETESLRAVIAGFGEETIEEFRIGLTRKGDNKNIYHGIIWPLYNNDEMISEEQMNNASDSALEQIKNILKKAGIKEIRHHPDCFNIEVTDEGHAPLFLNGFGELSFAELPSGQEKINLHFH